MQDLLNDVLFWFFGFPFVMLAFGCWASVIKNLYFLIKKRLGKSKAMLNTKTYYSEGGLKLEHYTFVDRFGDHSVGLKIIEPKEKASQDAS